MSGAEAAEGATSAAPGTRTKAKTAKAKTAKARTGRAKAAGTKTGTKGTAGATGTSRRAPVSDEPSRNGSGGASGLGRFMVRPDIAGPRVRVGVLWFLVAMAAATAGRWWTGVLWAVMAGAAGRELLLAWSFRQDAPDAAGSRLSDPVALLVAAGAALVPLAAAAGTGIAGITLVLVTLGAVGLGMLGGSDDRAPMAPVIAVVLPAVTAGAVVLVVRSELWAGLFLILAVSLYDAGNFVAGAESSSRLEGPITGMVGVLAVTFTMATFQAPPFDMASAWIIGGVVMVACPVGQWVTSAFLPDPRSPVRAMRRLDTYVLAAPLFLAGVWAVG